MTRSEILLAEREAATGRLVAQIKAGNADTEAEDWLADDVIRLTAQRDRLAADLAEANRKLAAARDLATEWRHDPTVPLWVMVASQAMLTRLGGDHEQPKPAPVAHHRTGPGKCACGFDAYKISGIMVDYHEELMAHLSRGRS